MTSDAIRNSLIEKGLKVTPQRLFVMDAISNLNNHPSAENIIEYIRKIHPNISVATVYKVLDALVANNLINRVKTEKDVMRYDSVLENHHHIYCKESEKIDDYFDEDLDELLQKYFEKKKIPEFNIHDIKLQIIGNYKK